MSHAVTKAQWDAEVLKSDVPVLVDFGATWCPPCRAIAPEIEAVSEMVAGKAKVVTVDVDSDPDLAARYGIQGIPALLVFKGGQVVEQTAGYMRRAELANLLLDHA
jgi:thioredoxin